MARKGVFPIVATLAVVGVVLAVFSQTVMRDSNISTNTMTTEQAYADLSGKMKRIGVQEVSVNPQQLDSSLMYRSFWTRKMSCRISTPPTRLW